jgi:hypothetical protein
MVGDGGVAIVCQLPHTLFVATRYPLSENTVLHGDAIDAILARGGFYKIP